jgi:hypothetical protein
VASDLQRTQGFVSWMLLEASSSAVSSKGHQVRQLDKRAEWLLEKSTVLNAEWMQPGEQTSRLDSKESMGDFMRPRYHCLRSFALQG